MLDCPIACAMEVCIICCCWGGGFRQVTLVDSDDVQFRGRRGLEWGWLPWWTVLAGRRRFVMTICQSSRPCFGGGGGFFILAAASFTPHEPIYPLRRTPYVGLRIFSQAFLLCFCCAVTQTKISQAHAVLVVLCYVGCQATCTRGCSEGA